VPSLSRAETPDQRDPQDSEADIRIIEAETPSGPICKHPTPISDQTTRISLLIMLSKSAGKNTTGAPVSQRRPDRPCPDFAGP
jgi:hypothetical protein